MSDTHEFSSWQICQLLKLSQDQLVAIVEEGIVAPIGWGQDSWRFDNDMLLVTRRAVSLHRQLHVDWPGVALALTLLQEIDLLKRDNRRLRLRLARYTQG